MHSAALIAAGSAMNRENDHGSGLCATRLLTRARRTGLVGTDMTDANWPKHGWRWFLAYILGKVGIGMVMWYRRPLKIKSFYVPSVRRVEGNDLYSHHYMISWLGVTMWTRPTPKETGVTE